MEEDLRPRLIAVPPEAAERAALRGFGVGLGLILFWFARHGRLPLAALGAASLLLAWARPRVFRPLFRLWMPVVGVLAKVNLWLLCGILYYLVVTPWGLLLRAFGLRPLELAPEPGAASYWVVKPARDPKESSRSIS